MKEGEPDPVARFFAAGFMAVGALIFGLCGACTVGYLGMTLYLSRDPGSVAGTLATVSIVAAVGGTPTALGFLLMRWGYRRYRAHRPLPEGAADGRH